MDRDQQWNNVSRVDLLRYLQELFKISQTKAESEFFVKLKIKRVVLFTEQNILQPNSAQLNQDTWILINQLNGDLGPLDDGQQGIDHRGYEGIDEAL